MGARASVPTFVPLSEKLKSPSRMQPECCIFKVHDHLREIRETAYKPQVIAIGPYHRSRGNKKNSSSSFSEEEEESKVNFSMMEKHKLWYLRRMLRRKCIDEGFFIEAIRPEVERVRNFYAEPLSFSDDELAEMMVLDGCFIIELLRKIDNRRLQHPDDPIFKISWIMKSLQRDLMLFENQLPFFVLQGLFGMIEPPDDERLVQLIQKFFEDILPDPRENIWDPPPPENSLGQVNHLLGLIHINWRSGRTPPIIDMMTDIGQDRPGVVHYIPESLPDPETLPDQDMRVIRCATELREAGVKFERVEGQSLFDIRFKNGTLQIPTLVIEDRTEAFLRNLVAYEQYCDRNSLERLPRFVTEYVCFLDNLVDTPNDVQILHRHGIIDNLLDDDEAVSDMFNKIVDSVIVPRYNAHYYWIEKRVNSHCDKRWNRWMAMLRHNHFNSPWGITSVVAGFLLLALAVTQVCLAIFRRK